jgi:hypothetical protein
MIGSFFSITANGGASCRFNGIKPLIRAVHSGTDRTARSPTDKSKPEGIAFIGIGLYAVRNNLQKMIRSTTVIILKYF